MACLREQNCVVKDSGTVAGEGAERRNVTNIFRNQTNMESVIEEALHFERTIYIYIIMRERSSAWI